MRTTLFWLAFRHVTCHWPYSAFFGPIGRKPESTRSLPIASEAAPGGEAAVMHVGTSVPVCQPNARFVLGSVAGSEAAPRRSSSRARQTAVPSPTQPSSSPPWPGPVYFSHFSSNGH